MINPPNKLSIYLSARFEKIAIIKMVIIIDAMSCVYNAEIQRGYPFKRALSAMRKHGG